MAEDGRVSMTMRELLEQMREQQTHAVSFVAVALLEAVRTGEANVAFQIASDNRAMGNTEAYTALTELDSHLLRGGDLQGFLEAYPDLENVEVLVSTEALAKALTEGLVVAFRDALQQLNLAELADRVSPEVLHETLIQLLGQIDEPVALEAELAHGTDVPETVKIDQDIQQYVDSLPVRKNQQGEEVVALVHFRPSIRYTQNHIDHHILPSRQIDTFYAENLPGGQEVGEGGKREHPKTLYISKQNAAFLLQEMRDIEKLGDLRS